MSTDQKNTTKFAMRRIATNQIRYRSELSLTQADLAARANVTVETIARLERSQRDRSSANQNPTLETLVRIADALGIELAAFIGEDAPKKKGMSSEERAWRNREASRLEVEVRRLRGAG